MSDGFTRREALVAGAGAIGLGSPAVGRARGGSNDDVTVATRNCYLGADLFRLLAAATGGRDAVEAAVSDLVAAVDRSHVRERMDAVAAEVGRTGPDLVGLQEVALIRTGQPGSAATDVRYDFRERLTSALADRNLPYRVVAETTTTDVQLPATVDGERRSVRLTDRDLLLAHESVTAADTTTGRFDAAVSLSNGDRSLSVERGYVVADATVGGTRLTVCNTHLESVSNGTRLEQATELEALLSDRRDPVALVGDFNSGPGGSRETYDRLMGTFRDATGGAGHTCCHAAGLRNAEPSLSSRIDHVLVRGDLGATAVTRVGADPTDRITVDGERLWPSDHAGVVATLSPDATPTAAPSSGTSDSTPTGTATATSPSSPSSTPSTSSPEDVSRDDDTAVTVPGFGVGAGVAGVVAAALATRRLLGTD